MTIDETSNFKLSFQFYSKNNTNREFIRFSENLDIEVSDKKKKHSFSTFSLKKNLNSTILNSLKHKTDLIILINSLQRAMTIKYLLKSYLKIKDDLLEIVKYKNKDRILILIKGKNIEDLLIYPFKPRFWIKNYYNLILAWHKTYL